MMDLDFILVSTEQICHLPMMTQDKPTDPPVHLLNRRILSSDPTKLGSTRPARMAPPRVGRYIPKIAKEAFKKFGFTEPHILNYWPEIVGAKLAKFAEPVKVSRVRGNDEAAVLTIRVFGPAALELQHREPQILQRINSYYGYRAVGRLRMIQGSRRSGRP